MRINTPFKLRNQPCRLSEYYVLNAVANASDRLLVRLRMRSLHKYSAKIAQPRLMSRTLSGTVMSMSRLLYFLRKRTHRLSTGFL